MNLALDTLAEWQKKKSHDPILEKELKNLKKTKDIQDAFGKKMEFGTAGIRGVLGAGTNRINIYTIGAAAQAYAEYLISNVRNAKEHGIVIGHDNRHNNVLFTEEVVKVMSFYKIKAYLFANNKLQPTPVISYAIRKLKAAGGVIITASHNPSQYNGFKVYNDLGGQLMPVATKQIFENMSKVDFLNINKSKFDPVYINKNLIDEYISDVLSIRKRIEDDKVLKVVYSPLHGTGCEIGPKLIRSMNISCITVKSQMTNDPNFSKTKSPNPEEYVAYKKGVTLARYKKADIVLLTDPDSDRVGVVCKYKRRFKYITGNQIACIYLNYLLSQMKLNNEIPENAYIVKSNVSSDLATLIAQKYGVKVYETNVGFKNIANLIENKKNEKFLFAFEESYGFLVDPNIARDKDGMQGLVAIVEAANYFKTQHSSIFNELLKLEKQFGFYRNATDSVIINQPATDRLFARLLTKKTLGDIQITRIDDYRQGLNGLEPTNMIKVYLKDFGWFAVRPSGTEPKVKYYFNLKSNSVINDVIILERAIKNDLEDITEDTEINKISRKVILKFSFFLLVLIAILVTLLFTVYETKGSQHGAVSIFVEIWHLMKNANKFWLFMLIISQVIPIFITSCFIYRSLKFLKQPVSYHRAVLANFLALCVSAITPFAIGGAVASYWYLRRKGIPRKELLAAYMMNSLIYQFSISIRTFIFIPIGFWLFSGIFFAGTISSTLILILTFVGFTFDIVATVMIGLLTLNKRLQTRIIGTSITFLEWLPFITIADPIKISSRYEYEFHSMRLGMRQLLENKLLMFELLLYEIAPIFISGYLFGALAIGVSTNAQLPGGIYINFITGTNLIRAANNMIPLPGGSGTTEWMSNEIYKQIFTGPGQYSSAAFTGLIRLWIFIFPTSASFLALILVYINERINAKVNSLNKNITLQKLKINKSKNRFKFWTLFVLVPVLTGIVVAFILVLFL